MSLAAELKRLGRHSLVYGIGGLVSRILAVLLLPLYTHYLTRADYGAIETLIALTAVLVIVLRAGISSTRGPTRSVSASCGRRSGSR